MYQRYMIVLLSMCALAVGGYWGMRAHNAQSGGVVLLNQLPETQRLPEAEAEKPSLTTVADHLVYPMTNYSSRITNRWYGKQIDASHAHVLACGDEFEGFHTGDDLEVIDAELSQEVPVYAIAEGKVRQVGETGGYGGLIVVDHVIGGEAVTAYYGHVDLEQTTVTVGEPVLPGQQISVLGNHCTSETSNERKHLHFSIRTGESIDVRGYVRSESELSEWRNPRELLERLGAVSPS